MDYKDVLEAARALPREQLTRIALQLQEALTGQAPGAPAQPADNAARAEAVRTGEHRNVRLQAKLAARVEIEKRRLEERIAVRQAALDQQPQTPSYYTSGARKKIDIRTLNPFGDLAARVIAEGRCGMDYDRLYTLWQAVLSAPPGHPFIEVGSYKGGSARFIAITMASARNASQFFVCDTFSGHPQADPVMDPVHYQTHKFEDTSADAVRNYLQPHRNVEIVAGNIMETSASFASVPAFGFVHVDVDVHPATAFCLEYFSTRLAPGAWIILDDYGFLTCPGARKAADDFLAARPEFRMLHLLTGQALIMRRDG